MSTHNKGGEDGIIAWLLISLAVLASLGFLAWLIASHKIVYFSGKFFDLAAFPWRYIPTQTAAQVVADLDMNYVLAMRHAAYVSIGDWISYGNLALKPWSFLFIGLMVFLSIKQFKTIKQKMINKPMSPAQLAKISSHTFSEIAPVLHIQEALVDDKLPGWRRQTFPIEMLEQARYQGKSLFIPTQNGGKSLDVNRLKSYLLETKKHKVGGLSLHTSVHLGTQIVNLKHDLVDIEGKKELIFMDRLSNEGKAILCILAPYAFNKNKGREESAEVKDALNYSAYGSKNGQANLAVEEAQQAFAKWRKSPEVNRLALKHHWEYPFLCALLTLAQRRGKIGTWQFIWLKPMNRVMFYSLNTVGRATPHAQAAMTFSQQQFDIAAAKKGNLPVDRELNSTIYVDKVIESFEAEWAFWLESTPESKEQDSEFDYDENSDGIKALLAEIQKSQVVPVIPASANDPV